MSGTEIDYEAIQQRVERHTKRRADFIRHLTSFLVVNMTLWSIWLVTSSSHSGTPWPIWITIFWGIGVVRQGINTFLMPDMDDYRDREMRHEIARENARLGIDEDEELILEKPKRKRKVRLGDDGELLDVEQEDLFEESSQSESIK